MKKLFTLLVVFALCGSKYVQGQSLTDKTVARQILNDRNLDSIQRNALQLLKGFSAGTSYNEVWIRDFNTFIRGSLKVRDKQTVKDVLLLFFKIQGDDGNIVDGLVDTSKAHGGYAYRYSKLLPTWAAHKNTVETDQESSLVQAVKKYIDVTGDASILTEVIDGKTVMRRMEDAMQYILTDRWSARYQLVKGATTIDWGDVQPEAGWGVAINKQTKWSIDIYDNAMFAIALRDLAEMKPAGYTFQKNWQDIAAKLKKQVRAHLWSSANNKYIPHLYLNGSPFSGSFDEKAILYTGGTICAIMAGFNTPAEIKQILRQFRAAAAKEKYATIGITVYPPYPLSQFPNMKPYLYQNAGDWTWFGGRIAEALKPYGLLTDAYRDLKPMLARAIENKGFYEWYDVQTGKPKGSGDFRGEAGVLYDAIDILKLWAKQVLKEG
ncbi:hypothetical protein ACFQZX_07255 [Mucilaginibacter litoreus]|uniref:Glycosyl hydrolase 36 catalytic domain-containing protein n=1 Tax=Mucilaginibacter litoreus TaxID=1048221 RepID=A0ABW3ARF2_9SPHI